MTELGDLSVSVPDRRLIGFEPRWLTLAEMLALHERLARFGGAVGIRDLELLQGVLDRPSEKWDEERADLPALAAVYAHDITRLRPFVGGNKRAAFVATLLFLRLNGLRFAPAQAEATRLMIGLAETIVSEDSFARWIRDRLSGD